MCTETVIQHWLPSQQFQCMKIRPLPSSFKLYVVKEIEKVLQLLYLYYGKLRKMWHNIGQSVNVFAGKCSK